MSTLVLKLGAAGDVVRTTTLLHVLGEEVSWLTADANLDLLDGLDRPLDVLPWTRRDKWHGRRFHRVVNLEDSESAATFLDEVGYGELFGAYRNDAGILDYSDDSSEWFDMSLISRHGREEADRRKLVNRKSYQEMIFAGLGARFSGEEYCLPDGPVSNLKGDVAIAPKAGSIWPVKNWAYFDELALGLRGSGLEVTFLPQRGRLFDHLADVRGHRCLVSGDSLPMHLALGSAVPAVTVFTCTSPWEIHDYGIQRKIVSPMLERFFYQREFDPEATTCVQVGDVLEAVLEQLATRESRGGVGRFEGVRE